MAPIAEVKLYTVNRKVKVDGVWTIETEVKL